jgi:hypothetical protein
VELAVPRGVPSRVDRRTSWIVREGNDPNRIIEIESQCDDLMFDVAMELIHESPTAAFTLLRPGMHVARVGNLPRDARGLDAKTMYTFALVNNDTNKGHAMFITRGPCETSWTAPLN